MLDGLRTYRLNLETLAENRGKLIAGAIDGFAVTAASGPDASIEASLGRAWSDAVTLTPGRGFRGRVSDLWVRWDYTRGAWVELTTWRNATPEASPGPFYIEPRLQYPGRLLDKLNNVNTYHGSTQWGLNQYNLTPIYTAQSLPAEILYASLSMGGTYGTETCQLVLFTPSGSPGVGIYHTLFLFTYNRYDPPTVSADEYSRVRGVEGLVIRPWQTLYAGVVGNNDECWAKYVLQVRTWQ